jgi:peroxiredoxin
MRRLLTILSALIAFAAAPAVAATFDPGPPVGAHMPTSFAAVDKTGAPATFASLKGQKGLVLMFFRSAKWCPYCQKQLIDMKAAQAPLEQRGYRLAAISYDDPSVLTLFSAKQGVGYTLLSDKNSVMIDTFKLRDPQYKGNAMADGVPYPAIFIVDDKGVIRAKLAEESYKVRPPVEAVISAVDGLSKAR